TPQAEAVVLLAKALGTTSDYLLGIKRDEESIYLDLEKRILESKESLTPEERMRLIMLLSSK
ncbi:MAG: XRE family transcriptional regulator, partial [Bacilli bacterium]|nr:XRE family transcriptional regulator [Bacilli bacterium]